MAPIRLLTAAVATICGIVPALSWCDPQPAVKRTESEPPSFMPSTCAMKAGTPAMTGFRELNVVKQYVGDKKILVLGTSAFLLPTSNGDLFNTGHHSTETLVPMHHFDRVGFTFDVATADGGALALEEWTFPLAVGYEDELHEMRAKVKQQFEKPKTYAEVDDDLASYAAIFLPGGHGPLIDMHTHESLGKLLRSAHAKNITTIALCHGPSALRSAAVGGEFPYKDYKIVVFPDLVDKVSPTFGYLPSRLRDVDHCEAKLTALGCKVQNWNMDDSVFVDRELITGASQKSAQKLAEAAIGELAKKFDFEANIQKLGVPAVLTTTV